MAGSVNKVILIGNLGADPEIKRTQDGIGSKITFFFLDGNFYLDHARTLYGLQ